MFKRPDKEAEAKAAEKSEFEQAMGETDPAPLEPVGADILTPEEIAQIKLEARAKVDAEIKSARKKALMADALLQVRIDKGLIREDEIVRDIPVTIDVAEYADRIMLDFKMYMHGHTYMVSPNVAATLYEIMARTYKHQAEIDGKSRFMGRPRDIVVSAKKGVMGAHGLMGRA